MGHLGTKALDSSCTGSIVSWFPLATSSVLPMVFIGSSRMLSLPILLTERKPERVLIS